MKQVRALHIIGTLSMGGIETWLLALQKLWAHNRNVKLDILVTNGERGTLDHEFESYGANIHYLRFSKNNFIRYTLRLRELLRHGQYDVVHDHSEFLTGLHLLPGLGRLPKLRVAHIHNTKGLFTINYGQGGRRGRSRRILPHLATVITRALVTDILATSKKALAGYGLSENAEASPRISVAYCGFDLASFAEGDTDEQEHLRQELQISTEAKVVLHVGRLDHTFCIDDPQNQKNTWFILETARIVLNYAPETVFLIVGSGEQQRLLLNERIESWGLGDRIKLLGVRRDVPRLMRFADLFVLPSREEGLGLAAVEAQAAGTQTLVSDGVSEETMIRAELFNRLPLQLGPYGWAKRVLKLMNISDKPPVDPDKKTLRSHFSIKCSEKNLMDIYRR